MTVNMEMPTIKTSKLFPIANIEMLHFFMDKANFEEKEYELHCLLYNVMTKKSNSRNFSDGLMSLLFTRDFAKNYRWPTLR